MRLNQFMIIKQIADNSEWFSNGNYQLLREGGKTKMKKWIIILVFAILLTNIACAEEITFCNIPWLSNEVVTMNGLKEAGLIRDGISYLSFADITPNYLIENEMGLVLPDHIPEYETITFSSDLSGLVKGRIVGYPIKSIKPTFAYDGEYHLIAIELLLYHAEYESLIKAFSEVYGEPNVIDIDEEFTSNIWKESDESAIVLYTQSGGLRYSLMYGRLDAKTILHDYMHFYNE